MSHREALQYPPSKRQYWIAQLDLAGEIKGFMKIKSEFVWYPLNVDINIKDGLYLLGCPNGKYNRTFTVSELGVTFIPRNRGVHNA